MKSFFKPFPVLLLTLIAGWTPAQENVFRDPGFESFRKKQQNPYWWQLVSDLDGTALSDFKDKHSGQKALKVSVREGRDSLTVRYFSAPLKTQISSWQANGNVILSPRQAPIRRWLPSNRRSRSPANPPGRCWMMRN